MFATALVLERDPLRYQDLPAMMAGWVRVVGLVGLVAVVLWLLAALLGFSRVGKEKIPSWQQQLFGVLVVLAGGLYVVGLSLNSMALLTLGGACAILAASFSFLLNLSRLSTRRIWAITRLSFKEALGRKVPYVFGLLLVIFLFANWYVPYNPQYQISMYVSIVYYAMVPLLLMAALVLGAFSIPTDIKQQTIHTILTKPVERFEVVLGRFLGFTGLLTTILLVMTTLSLLYVMRNVDPASAAESLRARDPAYGELSFEGVTKKDQSVGREWDYRSYISGPTPGKPPQVAVWTFPALPALASSRPVRCEFSFDVYRLNIGTEGQGLSCDFTFTTHNFKKGDEDKVSKLLQKAKTPQERDEVAEEYGYFNVPAKNIEDYHTLFIEVPGGLFRNALKGPAPAGPGGTTAPAIVVRVRNNSQAGYVGMARYDLYFLKDDSSSGMDAFWFAVNFFKGALGLWFRMVLMCGLAVALSTYLSGVISLLITCVLYLGGMFQDFIRTVAEGTNFGGGPLEALMKIATRASLAGPMEESAAKKFATGSDEVFRFLMRGLLCILPDVDRFSLTSYVADGFNIPLTQLVLSFIILMGYLLPWGVLAYYLIKWREIASQT